MTKSGDQIHKSIAEIWSTILQSGLSPECRNELIAEFPPFSNCALMEAPKLNLEVKASVTEASCSRDTRLASAQKRVCAAMSALGKVLTVLLSEGKNDQPIFAWTSAAARLLADIHHDQSQARRGLLKGFLNKELAETLTEASVDGWLFGSNLSERIKAAKALEKTSEDLKLRKLKYPKKQARPRPPQQKPSTSLNYRGPPRQTQGAQFIRQGGRQKQSPQIIKPLDNRAYQSTYHKKSKQFRH